MDLGHLEGISNRDIPIDGQAKGEAGLGHWRRALNGNCVASVADGRRIAAAVLAEMFVDVPLGDVIFRAGRKNLRGHYHGRPKAITLYGHPRLATLLHELAHHVVAVRYDMRQPPHGKAFKKTFVEVFRSFGIVYGVDIQAASMEALAEIESHSQEFKIGDIVTSQTAVDDGRVFKITGFGRTRIQMLEISSGRDGYRANPAQMVLVDPEPVKVAAAVIYPAPQAPPVAAKASPKAGGGNSAFEAGDVVSGADGVEFVVTGLSGKASVKVAALVAEADGSFKAGTVRVRGLSVLRNLR